jgi:hypothetical protein
MDTAIGAACAFEQREMKVLLPPSTNAQYQGARSAAWFLAFYGVAWIVPGMIHSFLPDGGAGVIAGLDLSHNPTLIFGMFAWAGATQIAHGIVTLAVALRYRTLVPLFLIVSFLERLLLSWSGWITHVPVSGHHPPEHYASLFSLPVILLFLGLSIRRSPLTEPEISA